MTELIAVGTTKTTSNDPRSRVKIESPRVDIVLILSILRFVFIFVF